MFTRITAATRDILQSEKGVVAIQMALVMTALLGMAGLAIDIGFALDKQRQMQSAADGAAFSAAIAKSTGHPAAFSTEAYAVAGQVGFVNGANGVTVTVNNPPVSPPASAADAANASAIQVIIQQPQTLPLVSTMCSLLPSGSCSGAVVVAAQAVAKLGSGAGCALETLGGSGTGVTISNGATVTLTSCGLVANSTGNPAILVTGGATLNTQSVSSSGFTTTSGGATINATNGIKNNQTAVLDPYAGVAMPSITGSCPSLPTVACQAGGTSYGWKSTPYNLVPGVWTNGVTFGSGMTYNMSPGVYFVDRGTFQPAGGITLNGTGVTIVLTSSTGSNYATASLGNGANVTLVAPTTGATQGIVFFGDRNAPLANTQNFAGGATFSFTGAIYFPSTTVQFSGGVTNPTGCTQLIAGNIQFNGGANFQNNCAGAGTSSIGGGATSFIE